MLNSRKLEDLTPQAQAKCRAFLGACRAAGIDVQIIQTLRDAEYQASLYAQGRTKPGPRVTSCDGYKVKSKHQTGTAWDAIPLDSSKKAAWGDTDSFRKMADIAAKMGIRAGFYWKAKDSPHFEIP